MTAQNGLWIGLGTLAWFMIWRVWIFRVVLKAVLRLVFLIGPVILIVALGAIFAGGGG